MSNSQVGKHISLVICVFHLGEIIHITRDTCFPGGGTHITRDMCSPGKGTHISRDTCFSGGGTHITRAVSYTHLTLPTNREV